MLAGAVLYGHGLYLVGRDAAEPIARWLFAGADHPAGLGVKGFYLLSGYLVFGSEQRATSTRRFLWHRALRIFPGLWACLLVTGVGFPVVAWTLGAPPPNWAEAWSYVARNAVFIREQLAVVGLFDTAPRSGDLNGSLWPLPYEIG